jgi:two-component system OmpR family response regulator
MRVLVIEDDPAISAFLVKGLREATFAVDSAADGPAGEAMARAGGYDLIVLDLMLPGRDGLGVLRRLRSAGQRAPVICLTARDTVGDRVAGLDAGADDYLVKPFSFAELLARIRAVLRRGSAGPGLPTVLCVADLRIDPAARTVERGRRRIDLAPREYALLEYLARNAGAILTRTMILEHVWDCNFDPQTNVVDVHINRLRRKIDDGASEPLIHTVRGVGYVLRSSSQ